MTMLHELGALVKDAAAWVVIYAVVIGLPASLLFSVLAQVLG